MKTMRSALSGTCLFVVLLAHGASLAQAPDDFSIQGRLTDDQGNPLDTVVTIQSRLYKGGTQIKLQTHTNTEVVNGVFNLVITDTDTISFDKPVDIGIKVGADSETTPLTPVLMAPYAQSLVHFKVYPDLGGTEGPNIVGGSHANSIDLGTVDAGAVLGGGSTAFPNTVSGDYGTVAGGRGNLASQYAGAISGDRNEASGIYSVVGGGSLNQALGTASFVGGGSGNAASDGRNTISGGQDNTAAAGGWTTIGGGRENIVGAAYAVVGGGITNSATALSAVVGGGNDNHASGQYAVVPGGIENWAAGNNSFAAGERAAALHVGSFVWQDATAGTIDTLKSTANYQFTVRASGGFRFLTNAAPDIATGAFIAPGGTGFSMVSSKSAKENFVAVDPVDYLKRLAAIDIYEWQMKTEKPQATHVGPFAEDFYAAFGHGSGETTINTTDADGVALVAIQGLYQIVQQQAATIEELKARLDRLE